MPTSLRRYNGFVLILTLILMGGVSILMLTLIKLTQLQTLETHLHFKTLQVNLLAQSGLNRAKTQIATLPLVTEPVRATTLTALPRTLTTPAGTTLYLAKSNAAVYSVGSSQNTAYLAVYRWNYTLTTGGVLTWTSCEKVN